MELTKDYDPGWFILPFEMASRIESVRRELIELMEKDPDTNEVRFDDWYNFYHKKYHAVPVVPSNKQKEALHKLAEVWNLFQEIPPESKHVCDNDEFCKAIHVAQNILIAQLYVMEHGNEFR